jgi:SAM-dependent methyltransferase
MLNKDIYGKALLDFQNGNFSEDIKTYSTIGGEDIYPLKYLFRDFNKMPKIEQKALQLASGKILDVGCGSGSHSLYLQQNNKDVLAIDISKGAIETCKLRGIKNTKIQDIWQLEDEKFDTILLLMNGAGMCGTLAKLGKFLIHLSTLLTKNGQILLDSTDVKYLYENENGDYEFDFSKNYYGETTFIMEYKNQKGLAFDWLYVDFNTLKNISESNNLDCKLILKDDEDGFLAQITLQKIKNE